MRQIKYIVIILIFALTTASTFAQSERRFIRKGNKIFMKAIKDTSRVDSTQFSLAENVYRQGLEKKPNDKKWRFNLADALFKQKKFSEAEEIFEELAGSFTEKEDRAKAYHNLGNSQIFQEKLDESIESYKKALRLNPSDKNTKYNLAYAQMIKKLQQQQQQKQQQNQNKDNKDQKDKQNKDQQNQNKDNKDEQNKDKNKQDQDKNKKDKNENKKDKQNQNKDNKQEQDKKKDKQQQNKISKKDAEQLLKALQNDEKKIQKKVKKAKAIKARSRKTEKEW